MAPVAKWHQVWGAALEIKCWSSSDFIHLDWEDWYHLLVQVVARFLCVAFMALQVGGETSIKGISLWLPWLERVWNYCSLQHQITAAYRMNTKQRGFQKYIGVPQFTDNLFWSCALDGPQALDVLEAQSSWNAQSGEPMEHLNVHRYPGSGLSASGSLWPWRQGCFGSHWPLNT